MTTIKPMTEQESQERDGLTEQEIREAAARDGWGELDLLISQAKRILGDNLGEAFALCGGCGRLTISPYVLDDLDSTWRDGPKGTSCQECLDA